MSDQSYKKIEVGEKSFNLLSNFVKNSNYENLVNWKNGIKVQKIKSIKNQKEDFEKTNHHFSSQNSSRKIPLILNSTNKFERKNLVFQENFEIDRNLKENQEEFFKQKIIKKNLEFFSINEKDYYLKQNNFEKKNKFFLSDLIFGKVKTSDCYNNFEMESDIVLIQNNSEKKKREKLIFLIPR